MLPGSRHVSGRRSFGGVAPPRFARELRIPIALALQGEPLRRRLLVLVLAAVLPLAAMAAVGLLQLARAQRAQAERAGLELTRALATAVDAELGTTIAVLQSLAVGLSLDTGDLRRYHEVLRRALLWRPDWITMNLADPSGRLLVNAERAFGEDLGVAVELVSLQEAVRERRPAVGKLTRGSRGELAVPVRVPVIRDGEVRYVLSAAVKPDAFIAVLKRQQLPVDWVVSIFDTAKQRVARSRRHEEFLAQPPSPSLTTMMESANAAEATGITRALEGDEIYTAFTRSSVTRWTVAIGIPTAAVDSSALRSLGALAGGVMLSLALGIFAAVLALRAASAADTERRQLLQREQAARAAAEAANRAKDEFLAMLGHELRNPLGALSNASQLLAHPRVPAESTRHAREIVTRQVEHLSRLTDDLLNAGRAMMGKIALERRKLDLAQATAGALETLRASGRLAGHRVQRQLAPAWVHADPTRVEQIVVNLVVNAVKFTPQGGSITVRVEHVANEAVVSVLDDGAGMPADLVSRVFDPFVQGHRDLDRAQGGLGIGLTLVRRLAELHGGRAVAESEGLGRGSEFRVYLPAVEPPARAFEPPSHLVAPTPRDVLIIEDNVDAADSLRALLEVRGHHVRVARDGRDGLAAILQRPPDVALVDVGLPGIDGYEVARGARAASDPRVGLRLVALTGYGLPEDRARALAAGFDEHLVKPVDPSALEALLVATPVSSLVGEAAAPGEKPIALR
jgi:signal transduction histidine kinase/CheY-like chemotaxis protein